MKSKYPLRAINETGDKTIDVQLIQVPDSAITAGSGTVSIATATGDVTGPSSSTDNAIARFDATTGKLLQNSTITVSDTGTVAAASGSLTLTTPVIGVATGTSLQVTGLLKSSSPTAGIGYATGAGGAQTQLTSKATTVVSNTATTLITMAADQLALLSIVSFTFTNSAIAATDHILVNHESGGTIGAYTFAATPGSGTSTIYVRNATAGNLSEAIVIRVTIIKAVSA
jgi:hypothetical protein